MYVHGWSLRYPSLAGGSVPTIRSSAIPWAETLTLYESANEPRSARAHRSRTVAFAAARGIASQLTVIVAAASPRFRSPTARAPLAARSLYQTCRPVPLSAAKIAWKPSASWSTPITSGFVRIVLVASVMLRTSLPAMRGADMRAHKPKCVRYSVSVMPPLPTSSMSGSLTVPGAVAAAWAALRSKMSIIPSFHGGWPGGDVQSSLMSGDIRHWAAVTGPQAHGSSVGLLSLALKTIDRPEAMIAPRQRA